MKVSFENILIFVFLFILTGLIFIGYLSIKSSSKIKDTTYWVNHTQEIINETEIIHSLSKEIVIGSRGFVITGDSSYLKPYTSAKSEIFNHINYIKKITEDNPFQQIQIDSLNILVEKRIGFSEQTIKSKNLSGFQNTSKLIASGKGLLYSTEINDILANIKGEENKLLSNRRNANQQSIILLNQYLILLLIGAIIFLVLTFFIIRRNYLTRKKVEEELKMIFNTSIDMIGISEIDGHFKQLNPAFEKTLGYTKEEFLSKPFIDFVHPDDVNSTLLEVQKLVQGIATISFQNRFRCKDNSYKWLDWSTTSIGNKMYSVAKDATKRMQIEEQIKSINKELEAFSYSVAHDLRAPLRIINGYSVILLEDYSDSLDIEGQRIINNIQANSRQMGQLIDDLLNFSHLGRIPLNKQLIDISEILKQIIDENIINDRIEIIIGDLAPIKADIQLIKHVFSNLISNAIKYSQYKEKSIIKIGSKVYPNEVEYFIQDNGVGFDMKYVGKLFGVFQRLHKASQFEGTGVGLAIVQRIILKHEGKIWAEAEPDKGATFYFSLPT